MKVIIIIQFFSLCLVVHPQQFLINNAGNIKYIPYIAYTYALPLCNIYTAFI